MRSSFARIAFTGFWFVLAAAVAMTLNSVEASGEPAVQEAPIANTAAVTPEVATTEAPVVTSTTVAPKAVVAKAVVAKTAKPAAKAAPAVAPVKATNDVEIATACVLTRNADGSITSEGC